MTNGDAWRARRPGAEEYHVPFYGGYVEAVGDGDVLESMERQGREMVALLLAVPEDLETHRYEPGKWSLREVVGHLVDSERVFQYRAAHIVRQDPAPLPGMDQEAWATASNAHERSLGELAAELAAVRAGSLGLFAGLDQGAWDRVGTASDRQVSVRALAWIIAGHVEHHRRGLRERYGVGE